MCDLENSTDEVAKEEHWGEGGMASVEDMDDREKDGRPWYY